MASDPIECHSHPTVHPLIDEHANVSAANTRVVPASDELGAVAPVKGLLDVVGGEVHLAVLGSYAKNGNVQHVHEKFAA